MEAQRGLAARGLTLVDAERGLVAFWIGEDAPGRGRHARAFEAVADEELILALRRHVLARTLSRRTIAPLQAAALAIVSDQREAQSH